MEEKIGDTTMKAVGTLMTTLIILIISVVLGIGVVLYGTSLSEPLGMKKIHVETFTFDIDIKKEIVNDSAYPILVTNNNGEYLVLGEGKDFIVNLTPEQQNSLYITVKTTGYDVDQEQTFRTNQGELTTCATSEIFNDGNRYVVCGINNDNWHFKYGNHISFVSYVHKNKPENKPLPIIYMNKTGVNMSNQPQLPYNPPEIVAPLQLENNHQQDKNGQLWWTDINGTDNCKIYKYDTNNIGGLYSYTYNGVGCTVYQIYKFDKMRYEMEHKSDDTLTEGTRLQMKWNGTMDYELKTIISQQEKIINDENIQLCLEVVKSPNNWVEIGKYLTQRGVNCTGLEIK